MKGKTSNNNNNNKNKKKSNETEKSKYIFFWKANQAHGYLSNWYMRTTVVDGLSFWSSEHHFMYGKAILMGDFTSAQFILACQDAREGNSFSLFSLGRF